MENSARRGDPPTESKKGRAATARARQVNPPGVTAAPASPPVLVYADKKSGGVAADRKAQFTVRGK